VTVAVGKPALAFLAAALALSAALSSCGLETVQTYDAPSFTYEGGLLKLTHDADNGSADYFLGYEIYYRAYSSETAMQTDREAIEDLADNDDSTPETCVDKLESLDFQRIKNEYGKDDRPLFTYGSDNTFYIQLSASSDWPYYRSADAPVTGQIVTRSISTSSKPVSFISQYSSLSDDDYEGSTTTTGVTVYFAFFAVAYGFDITTISNIYSLPRSTYTDISFNIQFE